MATLVWSFSPALETVELTPWCGGRHDGGEGAIFTKLNTCLYCARDEAIVFVHGLSPRWPLQAVGHFLAGQSRSESELVQTHRRPYGALPVGSSQILYGSG